MKEKLKQLIERYFNIKDPDFDKYLDDIGLSMLDQAELIIEVEDEFSITIYDEEAMRFNTLNDILLFLEKKQQDEFEKTRSEWSGEGFRGYIEE